MRKYQNFSSEKFHFLVVKFSVYLNRLVFVMADPDQAVHEHRLIRAFIDSLQYQWIL